MEQHFLISAMANSIFQVEKAFEGLTPDQVNTKVTPQSMSPMEQAEHLCEVYFAFLTEAKGGKYEWGQGYDSGKATLEDKIELICSQHSEAVGLVEQNPDSTGKVACDFIISHNGYHVGQLCILRMMLDAEWNPYCIYNH